MVLHPVYPVRKILIKTPIILCRLPVLIQMCGIVIVKEGAGRGMGPERDRDDGIDQKRRQGIPIGIAPELGTGNDLFTSDDHGIGGFGLLDIGKRESPDPHRAVLTHLLGVDQRNIGRERRKQQDRIIRFFKGVLEQNGFLPGRLSPRTGLRGKAFLLQEIRSQSGLGRE